MDIFNNFGVDAKKVADGVWFDLSDTAKVKVARWGRSNHNFLAKLLEASKANPGVFERVDEEGLKLQEKITNDVMADVVLLDWEGLTWKGEPLEYSKENSLKVLSLPEFNEVISKFSSTTQRYLLDDEEVVVKKSSKR